MLTTTMVATVRNIAKRIIQRNTTTISERQISSVIAQLPRQTSSQPRYFVVANAPSSHRGFATNKKKKNADSSEDSSSLSSYFERKAKAKERRIEDYRHKLERVTRINSRRDNSPKDILKNDFRSWWDGRRAYEEKLDRRSRQAGMDWTIKVATIVERLPIVMPDKEEFEREFEDLQAYLLAHRGKEYPKDFTGTDGDGQPEAYTDEELIALLPENFVPAPRETKADEDGTVSTLERRLKDRVYLMINDSFPTTEVKPLTNEDDECESLLEAALRGLREQTSGGAESKKKIDKFPLDLYCPSQAPLAVRLDAYDLEKQEATGRYGTKTFFMKVQYDDGTLQGDNIAWLDRTEIVERFISSSKDAEAKFYQYVL